MARFTSDDDEITKIDTDIEDSQFVNGDITKTTNTNIASGDGAVAAAQGATLTGVATGDGAQAAGDDLNNAEDGSAVIDGGSVGAFSLNSPGAVTADGDLDGVFNTGVANKSILADGDVSDSVAGDGNTQLNDNEDSAFAFGKGSNAFADIEADNSAFGNSGDVQQIQDNELGDNSQLAGRDAVSDDDVELDFRNEENNLTDIRDSENVNTAQDDSTADAFQEDVDVRDNVAQFREENTEIEDSFNKFDNDDIDV